MMYTLLKNVLEASVFQNIFSKFSLNLFNYCYREDPETEAGVLRSSLMPLSMRFFFNQVERTETRQLVYRNDAQRCDKYSELLEH